MNGEIHLRGANIFAGYWRREEATRAAFADGWFRTGDLATRSDDGYYTLCGRQSDLIISGGFQYLSARDRGVSGRAAGDCRGRGEGRGGSRPRAVPVAFVVVRADFDAVVAGARCRDVARVV